MKKSFKRIVAVLLAVMMIVCSFPLTALAADSDRTNVNLQFGDVSISSTAKTYAAGRGASASNFAKYTGLNSTKLEYSNGKITGYSKGNFFTITVLVENISKVASAEVAIKYSDSISPAYVKNANSGTVIAEYSEDGTAMTDARPLETIASQSGDAIHNTTHTLGETSYIDAENKVMHAKFSVQSGADNVDVSTVNVGKYTFTNTAVLATFMFKIVSDDAITFSIDTSDDNFYDDNFYLETIANGGSTDEYKTYVPKSENEEAELDFMGKNEYNGSTTNTYTITFNDEDGNVLESNEYEEGADVIAPALPAVSHDDEKHYTYSWDKDIASPATADATYTRVKTGAAHEWNQGEVTKEPTTTETGIKTYTCTFDGCGATKTEELPVKEETHTHTWGEWTYNGDQEFKVKDGTATRTCAECGETETKTINGTSLFAHRVTNTEFASKTRFLSATLPAQWNQFKNIYVKFTREDGKVFIVDSKDIVTDSYGYKYYPFEITPQSLASDIKVQYFGETEDGITVWGSEVTYNLMTKYIQKQISTTSNANWKKLLVELVYYGYENQIKANWKLDDPLTGYLTDDQKALHDSSIPTDLVEVNNKTYTEISNPTTLWRGNNCTFGASTEIMFYANQITLTDDISVHVKVEGESEEYVYSYSDPDDQQYFVQSGSSYTIFTFPDCPTKRLRSKLYVTLYKGDKVISNTFEYSAETYCYKQLSKDATASTQLTKITNQLMHFANAARAYFGVN